MAQGFYSTPKHNHKYRGRLIQTYTGRVPRQTPSRAHLDTLQTLTGIGLYGLHPPGINPRVPHNWVPCRVKEPLP